MNSSFPEPLLAQLSEFVAAQMGLNFPRERWRDLERGFRLAAREAHEPDAASFARQLLTGPSLTQRQVEVLASELTIGETYFFRERRTFDLLREQLLPQIIQARRDSERQLRIWSAGCCTGEEPYSIAILLDHMLPDLPDWRVTILGTDINPRFLQKAREGIFSEWSFRGVPSWLKENYFRRIEPNRFELLPRIKEMVTFACLNLASDTFPSLTNNTNAMDLILCRNVLMYFEPARAKDVIQHFHRSLAEGGWLIVSATETSGELFSPFIPVHFEGATFYRKGRERSGGVRGSVTIPTRLPVPTADPKITPLIPQPEIRADQLPPVERTPYEDASAFFNAGDYAAAARILNPTGTVHPADSKTAMLLARVHANLGELTNARAWVEEAIRADKLNSSSHYLRGVILQEQGMMKEAVDSLKRALYLDPHFVLAHFALGDVLLRQQKVPEAEKQFANVLDLLEGYEDDHVIPESDGLAAGRLREMIETTLSIGSLR